MVPNKSDLSTILVIDLQQAKPKTLKIRTRHVSRAKHYATLICLCLLFMVSATVFLSYKNQENERALRNLNWQLAQIKTQVPDGNDTAKLKNYIRNIEVKLKTINQYLTKRGIRGFSNAAVGGNSEVVADLPVDENYALLDKYMNRILVGITYTPLGYPAERILTSGFGFRSDPYDFSRGEFHPGLDFKGRRGDAVKSTASGLVIFAGWFQGYGKCVRIRHQSGYETLYGHLSRIQVKANDKVAAGQLIGNIGSTGRSTGSHLHYEVRRNNRPVNPSVFLKLN